MSNLCEIKFFCLKCGGEQPEDSMKMVCKCGGHYRPDSVPGIHGTRDSFGIKNIFKDDNSGQEIDTWKKWEKAGYRDPLETIKDGQVKEQVKDKIKKVKNK